MSDLPSRAQLVAQACRGVSDERLALLIEFGGVQRCVEMVDWDKPEPTWTEREIRHFNDQVKAIAFQTLTDARDESTRLITAGTFRPSTYSLLITIARKLAVMSEADRFVVGEVFELTPQEVQAWMEWALRTATWEEFKEGGRRGVD